MIRVSLKFDLVANNPPPPFITGSVVVFRIRKVISWKITSTSYYRISDERGLLTTISNLKGNHRMF